MCIRDSNKCVTAFAQEPLDAAIKKISPELFDQYEIFKSRELLLEWSPKNVHKATGLAKLIKHLGIDQSQVMACGDEANAVSYTHLDVYKRQANSWSSLLERSRHSHH